jgi:cobyrinic acid a,c-diamide synthase
MIAAPQGRSGKTIVAIGLCAALRKKGLSVKPFKKGPDYIDPSWLAAASKETCSNLDPFMFTEPTIRGAFQAGCAGKDIAVIEGSMGLYDTSEEGGRGSSAWLARLLQTPVILVVNASRMARSAAAMVKGYQDFEPDTDIAGVILNNVSGARHVDKLIRAIESYCGIPVLGAIPRTGDLKIKERHLGIVPFIEQERAAEIIDRISELVEANVDIDRLLAIARRDGASDPSAAADAPEGTSLRHTIVNICRDGSSEPSANPSAKIAILRDKAFSFYYPENLEALCKAGAELVYVNSFRESLPADTDGLYIGGGFPELYAGELEKNAVLRHSIARLAGDGLPVYAECAGLLYLCRSVAIQGRRYEMTDVLDCDATIENRPQGHGYMEVEVTGLNPFFAEKTVLRSHEFHHSRLSGTQNLHFAFKVRRGHGIDGSHDGIMYKNVIASYMHIHALAVPAWADHFVKLCSGHKINLMKTPV